MIPLILFTPGMATIIGVGIRHSRHEQVYITRLSTRIPPKGFYYNWYFETLLIHSCVSIGQHNE